MSAAPPLPNKPASWGKRLLWAAVFLLAVLVLAAISLRVFITTPSGARFIENQINTRTFGPIDGIEISGLSGDPLKSISVDHLAIKDKDGVWLRARDLELQWKPFAIFKTHFWIHNLSIQHIDVLRRPAFTAQDGGGSALKVTLERYRFDRVSLEQDLIGQSLAFSTAGQFTGLANGAITASLDANRLDAAGDNLTLAFSRTAGGNMSGDFAVEGVPEGVIATLLRAPDRAAVTGRGTVSGDDIEGQGNLIIAFDNKTAINANAMWNAALIDVSLAAELEDWAAFDALRQRVGSSVQSQIQIDRAAAPMTFNADINVPGLTLSADGQLPDKALLPASANVELSAKPVSEFLALPHGYSAGAFTAKGQVRLAAPYAFDGDVNLADIETPQGGAQQISGAVAAAQAGAGRYGFDADLTVLGADAAFAVPIDLAGKITVQPSGQYDLNTGRITLDRFLLTLGQNQLNAAGHIKTDISALDLKGAANFQLKPNGTVQPGRLTAQYAILKTPDTVMTITTDGALVPAGQMAEPLGGLIGEQLIFKSKMNLIEGGVQLSDTVIIGGAIKAAIEGTISERLDLSGEAILTGPFAYSGVRLDEGAEAAFAMRGPRTDPAVRIDASSPIVTAQGFGFTDARLRTEFSNVLSAPKGPLAINVKTPQGPLSINTQFASTPFAYAASDIDLSWGRLAAGGDIAVSRTGIATGELSLRLPERGGQYLRAALHLDERANAQGVGLIVDAKQIAISNLKLDSLSGRAQGTLAALTGELSAQGQYGDTLGTRRMTLEAPFSLRQETDQGLTLSSQPMASYGDIDIRARAPITASYSGGDIAMSALLSVADGEVDIAYNRQAVGEALKFGARALPVTLIPMPGTLADTRGRISGQADVSSGRTGMLSGGGVLTLSDWRGFGDEKGQGLTTNIHFDVSGGHIKALLSAQSPAGFSANGDMLLPRLAGQSLKDIRLNMSAPMSGSFKASGAAASVFRLFTPGDVELGGTLSANISLSGTPRSPQISGHAGGQDIQFEAPEFGTRVQHGRFTADFTNDTFRVQDVYASDAKHGTISGSGAFRFGPLGRPIGTMQIKAENFQALDRSDVEAEIGGAMTLTSEANSAALSGDITINEAQIKQFASGGGGRVGVVEIEVVDINRPEKVKPELIKRPPVPIMLDVRVLAPRRVFVRSRGLDIEMAADTTIKGTALAPEFYGEAKILRGGYKLAGKSIKFDKGAILFDGDIASASVNFEAVTETQNLEARVKITGTVQSPKIELSSTPERPQDEILSALLFGRSATELSGIEAAQLAGSLAKMSGKGGGFDLLGGLRDAFGIAQLSLAFSPDGSAQLVGGRYLAKGVYLQVFSGVGPEQTGAIIDWEIRKNLALRSRVRADNDQALSLKWKRDF